MRPLIVYGAGGHAKVVLDVIYSLNRQTIGIVQDAQPLDNREWRNIPAIGSRKVVPQIISAYPDAEWIVAIGNNQVRSEIVAELRKYKVDFATLIHPSSTIGSQVQIGEGTIIMAQAVIQADSVIGKHVIINTAASIDHDSNVEDYVHLSPGVRLSGNVHVANLVHLGTGSIVIPGISIGDRSIIGAGAVVIDSMPANITAVGCPARIIKGGGKND